MSDWKVAIPAKVLDYKIINDGYHVSLERQVNELLTEGWHLKGDLTAVATRDGDIFYQQVMIKYE